MILYQELRPGEQTSVAQLVSATGLSRAPVKSAVERLSTEGLLEVRGRRGTYVAKLEQSGVAHLFEMRRIYEEAAAPLIAKRITDEQVKAITDLVPRLSEHYDGNAAGSLRDEMVRFIDADVEFHERIIAAANNPYLLDHYSSLNLHLLISHYLMLGPGTQAADRHREHIAIAAAVRKRDGDAIAATLIDHTDAVKKAILSTMREFEAVRAGRKRSGP